MGLFVKFTPFQPSINDYLSCFGVLLGWVWVVFGFCLAGNKRCRRAPLFTAPADAARQERCLWSVSRVRPGTGRALLPLPAGVGDSVRQPVALF